MRKIIMEEEIKKLLDRIETLQNAKGWTRKELARRAGVSPTAVYEWFKYTRCPSLESIIALSSACDISVYEFFAETAKETTNAKILAITDESHNLTDSQLDAVLSIIKNIHKE